MAVRSIIFLLLLSLARPALAEESPVDIPTDLRPTAAQDDDTHPLYSTDTRWASAWAFPIARLFLAAAVIGPIVRAEAPQAVPVAISHEEDPAVDRHDQSV